MEKSLKWKANIIYEEDDQERDWVLVDGKTTDITGIGNSNVAITVVNTTNASSILNARVEFIYYDENDKEIIRKYVNVCRCLLCGCDNLEFWPEPCGCENLTITNITMCTCNNFTLEKTSSDWDWDDIGVKEISFTADTCIVGDITNTALDDFNIVVDRENSKIKINPTSENRNQSERGGTITINYTSNPNQSCSSAITVTQQGRECKCEDFGFTSSTDLVWDWNKKEPVSSVTFTADTCISDITAPTSEHFNVAIEGNAVKVSPKESNHGAEINETITITYKAAGVEQPCDASIHAKHKEMICTCNNLPEEKIEIKKSWENNNQ